MRGRWEASLGLGMEALASAAWLKATPDTAWMLGAWRRLGLDLGGAKNKSAGQVAPANAGCGLLPCYSEVSLGIHLYPRIHLGVFTPLNGVSASSN